MRVRYLGQVVASAVLLAFLLVPSSAMATLVMGEFVGLGSYFEANPPAPRDPFHNDSPENVAGLIAENVAGNIPGVPTPDGLADFLAGLTTDLVQQKVEINGDTSPVTANGISVTPDDDSWLTGSWSSSLATPVFLISLKADTDFALFFYDGGATEGAWDARVIGGDVKNYALSHLSAWTVPEPASVLTWSMLSIVGIAAGWWRRRQGG